MCILYRHYSRRVTCDCSHTQPPTCMTKCCQTFLFGEGAIPVSFSTVFLRWPAPQKNGDWCAFNSSGTADFLSSKRHLWRRGDGEIAGYWKKFENLVSASSGRSVKWSMKGMFNQFLAHAKELSIRLHDTFLANTEQSSTHLFVNCHQCVWKLGIQIDCAVTLGFWRLG